MLSLNSLADKVNIAAPPLPPIAPPSILPHPQT